MSPFSGQEHTREINTTQEKLDSYERGEGLIQHIFPDLSPDDREFIMTGITPEEWNSTFQSDEEDDS